MKRTTVSLIGMVLLLFAFSVPAVYAQVECNNDAECEDGLFCTVNSCSNDGSVCIIVGTPCEATETCDEASDSCVECVSNDNCTGETPYCVENICVECGVDRHCDDELYCTGQELCVDGVCVAGEDPCDGRNCIEGEEGPICAACDNDTDCDDGIYCNGVEFCDNGTCMAGRPPCQGNEELPICDEQNQRCVECDNDTQCGDGFFCNGLETCNETSGACEEGEEPCEDPLVCDEVGDQCVECLFDRDCGESDTPYCDNETLSCVECLFDDDCDSSEIGPYCDDESLSCVECIVSEDCENDNETCREGVCQVAACELKIRPKKVRISRMYRPVERRFKIQGAKGSEGFDPYGQLDFGFLQPYIKKVQVTKKGKLKVWVKTPTGARLFKGPLEIRVGDCVGEVLFK